MTHNELLKEIDRYLVPTLAESEIGNKAIGILKALRAVVELHKPYKTEENMELCSLCANYPNETYPCETIHAIRKELV